MCGNDAQSGECGRKCPQTAHTNGGFNAVCHSESREEVLAQQNLQSRNDRASVAWPKQRQLIRSLFLWSCGPIPTCGHLEAD